MRAPKKNQIYFNIFNGIEVNTHLMAVPETIQPLVDKYTFHRDEVTNLEHEMTMLQRKIEAMDGAIDKMVSELYELTQEEIRIVNGAS